VSTRLGSAIEQSMKSNNCDSLPSAILRSRSGNDTCRLCDPDGISSVFYDISDRIQELSKSTTSIEKASATCGHASIPMAPPKKAKREEVLAVAVICLEQANSDNCWLMVKRPAEGLLAGQWEFPSVCVWDSSKVESKKDKKAKTKLSEVQVPHIDASVRYAELSSFLSSILQLGDESSELIKERVQVMNPIVHVFSHVCHTMYVEKSKIQSNSVPEQKRWQTKDGRYVGWFTEKDMRDIGITSGVRKALALSDQA
jgi:A/G-specific adenine glycosylase